jgi:glycosyltransferase involved in cell wall biosynthesis
VGLDKFPIPAIRGGAIESGVTKTIEINEELHLFDLTVITISDPDLDLVTRKYRYCQVIQVKQGFFLRTIILLYRIVNKILGYRFPRKTAYMQRVNKELERGKFDIVQFATSNEQVAELSDKVSSVILYGVESDYLTMNSYGISKILNRVDYFVAGPYIKERLMTMLDIPEERIITHYYSIDSTIPDEAERKRIRADIRAKHNIPDTELVLLYVGRLSPEKGPLQLVQAMQHVENCRLIVVGGADFSSSVTTEYVKLLNEEARKCPKEVIFTGFLKDHEDVKKYMFSADLACVPSICNEAGSIALLEFRVASLPTIISDKGGMHFHAGGNAVTVKCDDHYVEHLKEAIQHLCDDCVYRMSLAKVARHGLEMHTPREAFIRRYKELSGILATRKENVV